MSKADKMLKLKIDLNLVVFGFFEILYVSDSSHCCEFWLWLPSNMADKMLKLKIDLNLLVVAFYCKSPC